ncbi:hypothetical protein L1987_37217 [Smallanthus sonchifolius]|uniref:Uncharacterized protein n=1 Tax=Smallanthus sonchifolius TaxID=185202 RepID=A0ACB9HHJ1_9ASTR|nr:hypothetical protein L1987_37217 [Smallanthus sonchifolius]
MFYPCFVRACDDTDARMEEEVLKKTVTLYKTRFSANETSDFPRVHGLAFKTTVDAVSHLSRDKDDVLQKSVQGVKVKGYCDYTRIYDADGLAKEWNFTCRYDLGYDDSSFMAKAIAVIVGKAYSPCITRILDFLEFYGGY